METTIFLSLTSTFLILFISKIGLREYVQTYGHKVFAKLFSCDFCLSFWLNLILSIILYIFVNDPTVFFYAVTATPLTRYLL